MTIAILLCLFVSLVMLGITPLAGKTGRLQTVISASTVAHELEQWDLDITNGMIEVPGFEQSADADSAYWIPYLAGMNTGDIKYGGTWDTGKNPVTSFKAGKSNYTSIFAGLSTTVGFTCTGKNKSIGGSQNVKQAGKFRGVFQIEGVTTYPS